jgi:Na+-driven multidrug efflux pump
MEGLRNAFRCKLYIGAIATLIGIAVFLLFGQNLIYLFLQAKAMWGRRKHRCIGFSYLKIMMIGLVPFFLTQTYASTLKRRARLFCR